MRHSIAPLTFAAITLVTSPAAACGLLDLTWQRSGDPVLRDPIPGYEIAGDAHVFARPDGGFAMVYSGDENDRGGIKLALSDSLTDWQPGQVILGPSQQDTSPMFAETAFYHLAPNGEHQIYFIGHNAEATYQAEIYLATANALEGPYAVHPEPVIRRGSQAGRDVYLMTSPSILLHDGQMMMTYLAWNGYEDVTIVWVMGAISSDNGRTWGALREVEAPIGMEGQITPLPNGGYVATRASDYQGVESTFLACADHPFGPYQTASTPIMSTSGEGWEVDEATAAQITFDPATGDPHLFYTGANHAKGWWILHATPDK